MKHKRLVPLAAITLLTLVAQPLMADPPQFRSVTDWRQRIPRQMTLPYTSRQTHRGWEYRTNHVVVVSSSTPRHARQAAESFESAWNSLADVVGQFRDLRRANAGAATMVVIDGDRPRDPELADLDLQLHGESTLIYLNVAPDRPRFDEQVTGLQIAAGHAFFHTHQLDQTLPAWVRSGLADYALDLTEADRSTQQRIQLALDRDRQQRQTPDTLQSVARPGNAFRGKQADQAGRWVRFFLTADEGKHREHFLASLKAATEGGPQSQLAQMQSHHADTFASWTSALASGEPLLVPAPYDDDDLRGAQNDLFVLLKLARRWQPRPAKRSDIVTAEVIEFDPTKKDTNRKSPKRSGETTEANAAPSFDLPKFSKQLTSASWSTRDSKGQQITEQSAAFIADRLELEDQRTRIDWRQEQLIITYRWNEQLVLEGVWEDHDDAPIIRFRVRKLAVQPKVVTPNN